MSQTGDNHRFTNTYTEALIWSGAIQVAPDERHLFLLRNGALSAVYVDHAEVLCEPEYALPFESALASYVSEHFSQLPVILCNVDSKSSPQLVGALAAMLSLRQIIISPKATQAAEKGRNLRYRFPQTIKATDTVVMIDDVFTPDDLTASSIAQLIRGGLSKQRGFAPQEIHLLVGLLRGEAQYCVQQLGQLGIRLHWIVTLDEVMSKARQ